MKTSELTDLALIWAVAKGEGVHVVMARGGWFVFDSYEDDPPAGVNEYNDDRWQVYTPSTDWAQGGPILERECIEISCIHTTGWTPDTWTARHPQRFRAKGPTPLIAAMRCFVASKLGDDIEVPEELI